jgi:flagellar hook-basal body complex protein FliE
LRFARSDGQLESLLKLSKQLQNSGSKLETFGSELQDVIEKLSDAKKRTENLSAQFSSTKGRR